MYALGHGLAGAAGAFLAGSLIDVDHLLDYVLAEGPRLRWNALASGSYFRKRGKALVLLHSYECVILAGVILVRFGQYDAAWGVVCGALTHLFSDVVYYRFTPLCYSLTYRLVRGFRLEAFKYKRISQGVAKVL
ncbi:MAG TPA: hypothetical protein VME66_12745 [Candidatus Acidoferrales bacterium]|nr:hypothetical protein [Candidatus Acidoferrales bacterium]